MRKLTVVLSLFTLVVSASIARAQANHEYSPLAEKTVNYKTWSLPNLVTQVPEDVRKVMAGKKLVMIVYFAPWCGNWKNEAPIAAKLYEKYKDKGFQVIGISEYAPGPDTYRFPCLSTFMPSSASSPEALVMSKKRLPFFNVPSG